MKNFKLAVASGKGGVGKSMLSSSLCLLFSQKYKITAVDCDVDAPNLHLWLGQNENWDKTTKISTNEIPVIDKNKCNLCGKCVDICAFNALKINTTSEVKSKDTSEVKVDPLYCEGCAACQAICPQNAITMKQVDNGEIKIINNVFGFPLISAQLYPGQTGSGKIVDQIKKRAEKFKSKLTIIDSPAGTGCPVIAALNGADFAVLITEPTPSGFSDLKRVLEVVNHFKIPWAGVINKWDINKKQSDKIEKWIKKSKGHFLGKISYDKKIFKSISQLKPILKTNLPAKKEIEAIFNNLTKIIK